MDTAQAPINAAVPFAWPPNTLERGSGDTNGERETAAAERREAAAAKRSRAAWWLAGVDPVGTHAH